MIERADQLVLDYVSRAADLAHGVLRQDQRLDFVHRLRGRIEQERAGSVNARAVTRILARLGEPGDLVRAEQRRLAARHPEPSLPGFPAADDHVTAVFPRIVDDHDAHPPVASRGRLPAGVRRGQVAARRNHARPSRRLPGLRLRRAAMATANPMATGGRDARTILKEYRREAAAMILLVAAALLVPFRLPSVAIFEVPVLVWAGGALIVLWSEGWSLRDRLIGLGAPLFGYLFGGLLFGGIRAADSGGFQGLLAEFFGVSGVMFMLGTAGGVGWLGYRLLNLSPR